MFLIKKITINFLAIWLEVTNTSPQFVFLFLLQLNTANLPFISNVAGVKKQSACFPADLQTLWCRNCSEGYLYKHVGNKKHVVFPQCIYGVDFDISIDLISICNMHETSVIFYL